MKRILILTELYNPENTIINYFVKELSKTYKITVITRAPSYPKGKVFSNYRNWFSKTEENGITVYRYPIFLSYNDIFFAKLGNFLWQPIINGLYVPFISWDKLFVYQTGSLYSYSLLIYLRLFKKKSVIWSQDLWPEAGYELGFPKIFPFTVIIRLLTKLTLGNFKQILVQNKSFKDHYLSIYNLDSKVIHNFSTTTKKTLKINRKNNYNIIYAGNIGFFQNLEGIIMLYNLLKRSYLPIESLDIYGEGSKFNELSSKYGPRDDINFFGQVTSDEIVKALENCRYAIFSLKEGIIQKTIPSRLQFLYNNNVPLIYLGSGASKDFINENSCGVVVDTLDQGESSIIQSFVNFERHDYITPDLFNKELIIESLKTSLL